MSSITIRNVPEETRAELALRAASRGQSMQEYLRALLVVAAERADQPQLWSQITARVERDGIRMSDDEVLALRDADRR